MVIDVPGSKLKNVSFEDLIEAIDKDPEFRKALIGHLSERAGSDVSRATKNNVSVEARANFDLDDAKIFDLNGDGLKVTIVAVN